MKKILFVINHLGLGGAERLVIDDINELVRRNYDVRLITLRPQPEKNLLKECLLSSGHYQEIIFNSLFDFKGWVKLLRYIKKTKPDLIFSHLWYSNTIVRLAGLFLRFKNIICFEHNIYDSLKTKKQFWADKLLQNFCVKIIAVSSAVKTSLINNGINKDKIDVLINSVDIERFRDNKNNLLGSDDMVKILFVGRLINQKGVDILIKSFAGVESKNKHLFIVGQGTDRTKLGEMVLDLQIDKNVTFLGPRFDVPDLMSSADIFVVPSRYEGLGIVVLEAMATGLPIIISDFPAAYDMLEDNEAIFVKREDEKTLTQALKLMIENPDLRLEYSRKSFAKALSFSIKNHVDKLLVYLK